MKHLLQEMELLDKNNNPLTHAKYHREEVKEAVEREKQPLFIDVPMYLEEQMRQYLAEVSFHLRLDTISLYVCSKQGTIQSNEHIWAFWPFLLFRYGATVSKITERGIILLFTERTASISKSISVLSDMHLAFET